MHFALRYAQLGTKDSVQRLIPAILLDLKAQHDSRKDSEPSLGTKGGASWWQVQIVKSYQG